MNDSVSRIFLSPKDLKPGSSEYLTWEERLRISETKEIKTDRWDENIFTIR